MRTLSPARPVTRRVIQPTRFWPEVHDRFALGCFKDAYGFECFMLAHGRAVRRYEVGVGNIRYGYTAP